LLAARRGEADPNTSIAIATGAQILIDIVVFQSRLQHYFPARPMPFSILSRSCVA
jgi:hypothetical protein